MSILKANFTPEERYSLKVAAVSQARSCCFVVNFAILDIAYTVRIQCLWTVNMKQAYLVY